jgi:hypothetical protein
LPRFCICNFSKIGESLPIAPPQTVGTDVIPSAKKARSY